MTEEEFNFNYYVATGHIWCTAEWIRDNRPEEYKDRVFFFIKLVGHINLLLTVRFGGKVTKYGRFDRLEFPEDKETTAGDFTIIGATSELTDMLMTYIFTGAGVEYLLTDDGEFLLTDDGERILL